MRNENDIEKILSNLHAARLDTSERERVWQGIEHSIINTKVSSGWMVHVIHKPMITGLIVALAILLGVGGTAAADNSRPGDSLFGVDRAVERVRIALANSERKDDLRAQFAEERVREINELISDDSRRAGLVTADALVEIEADVFTDETVVKIELNDRQVVFVISARTREAIVEAIAREFGLHRTLVDERLRLETEDRASRPDDRKVRRVGPLSDEAKERIRIGISATADELVRISDSDASRERISSLLNDLSERISDLPEDVRVKIEDDRLEIRTEDGRIRIEVRADAIVNDDDSDDDQRQGTATQAGLLEIEADIFTDITVVTVELNDVTTRFTTPLRTRDSIIDEIRARFSSLTREDIDQALRLETEDRASRPDDISSNEEKDEDEDKSGDDDGDKSDD